MSKEKHKYVIRFQNGLDQPNAVAKAPSDVSLFLEKEGYERIDIMTMGKGTKCYIWYFIKTLWGIIKKIKNESFVVVQYPVYSKKGSVVWACARWILRNIKRCKNVAVIHDLQSLRNENYPVEVEIKELDNYSALVVHSDSMTGYLQRNGCKSSCYTLGLFDYAVGSLNTSNRSKSFNICFAGNLSKSLFLKDLHRLCDTGLSFSLYGSPEYKTTCGIIYCGSFPPDVLPELKGSWGLVWDGPSIEGLMDDAGTYQKFNSPHKASLYIMAGMPLVVSSESAIADIVKEEKLGICVESLMMLNDAISSISDNEYKDMEFNVRAYAIKLQKGYNIISTLNNMSVD